MKPANGKSKQNSANDAKFIRCKALVLDTYLKYYQEHDSLPTQTEVASICDIDRATVARHLQEMKLEDIVPAHKARTEEILAGLGDKAKGGDPAAVKLWMQLVYGWREKVEHLGKDGAALFDGIKYSVWSVGNNGQLNRDNGAEHVETNHND